MASEPESMYTQNSQLCSLCTLGGKSQWTMVYFVTLIVGWFFYVIKNFIDMSRDSPLSDNGISINVLVSFIAWIVAAVVMPSASADDETCQTSLDPTMTTQSVAGQKHNNATFLLISISLGYVSIIGYMYSPHSNSISFISVSVFTLFCLIFLIFAAATKNKSLHQCNKVNFKDSFISSSNSETSSIEQDCTANTVTRCNKSQTSRCRNQMHKNNHKSFNIKYLPTNNTSWSILENKPNWEDISSEMNAVLYTFYTTPFQIRLLSSLTSVENTYVKAYSLVEWESTPIPQGHTSLANDTLIAKLDANNGLVSHKDVTNIGLKSPMYAGKWHQKEVYYTPFNVGNHTILQRVSTIPLNTSLDDTTDVTSYITIHHELLTGQQTAANPNPIPILHTQTMTNGDPIPLHGMSAPSGGYDNPTEAAVIQNMKQVFETENSYVELTLGNQSVYLTPKDRSNKTTITCTTFDKAPTAADIEPLAETTTSSASTTSDESCGNVNDQSIYYEYESKAGPERRFLINASITSLFAAIAFLRPSILKKTIGGAGAGAGGAGAGGAGAGGPRWYEKYHFNWFSLIAILQMFMFFYVSTGFSSTPKGVEYFWVSAVFSLLFTFAVPFIIPRMIDSKYLKEAKKMDATFIKTLSALFSVLFNVFLLCHLIVQLSTGSTSTNPTYSTERESVWYVPALVCLLVFLLLPFDEESMLPATPGDAAQSYIARIFKTGSVRLLIFFLFIICTTVFSNNYFDIPRTVRLISVIIISIALGFLSFPKFNHIFNDDYPHLSDNKLSIYVIIILSVFFSLNNFSQSFSNYATESGSDYNANVINLYTASSTLLIGFISLITTQFVFGKGVFYPLAIMCIIPFLTLYQYHGVPEQAPSDVCSLQVAFGQGAMLYNSKTCGDGSIVSPDNDCQFSTRQIQSVKMLDKNNHCQVMFHENVGQNSGKTVWDLKHNDLKFNENCSDTVTEPPHPNACLKNININASAVTVLQRCQLRIYPASNTINPDTQKPMEMGFHLRIKKASLGIKGLQIEKLNAQGQTESDFEAWIDNATGYSERADPADPAYALSVWKKYKFDRIEVVGSGYKVFGFEDITAAKGLSWMETPNPQTTTASPPTTTPPPTTTTTPPAPPTSPPTSPPALTELVNALLSQALSRKTVFTAEEWSAFNVQQPVDDLTYVKSGSKYYKPTSTFEGPRHEFTPGTNSISPPKSFNSFVIDTDTTPMWPEVLPFIISNTNSVYVNILWIITFYLGILLVPVIGVSKGVKSELMVFMIAFLSSILMGILNNNGIYNRGMGLGGEGLTGSEPTAMDPNVFACLFAVCVFFALATERAVFTTGVEKGAMTLASFILFGIVFLATASSLPILICCGIVGLSLVPGLKGRNKIVAMTLPILTFVAMITAWTLGRGTLPCEAYGIGLKSASGEYEYGSCYTPTGNFWEDIWNQHSHFFVSIGYRFEDFFTGITFQKIATEFEKVVAKLEDDNIHSFCNTQDSNNPLCVTSRRNKCEFSYCISPPDPIRMSGFGSTYDASQIEQMKKSRCNSHKLFQKAALKAISDNKASAKQIYCVNYHKNDDCSNVCKQYWKNDSDPVSRESLAKLESRLEAIDDSILEISPEEWVQMKKENLGV